MKKVLVSAAVVLAVIGIYAFAVPAAKPAVDVAENPLKWYTFEEAVALSEKNPKKMFIDVYTDWCGWCKKMDANTFSDPKVAAYLAENYYPVKFNAEQKDNIAYKGHTLKFIANHGRRGVHELAVSLLEGQLGYPSFVYLDEKQDRISISPGYKDAATMLKELRFIGGDHFKTMSYEQFVDKGGK
ncbi:MAG: DUF255 domain-containing protein [Saprospiraceae bacterium]|nr:DUF255 domain-containing protein [Saprospiraceae bacterium]